ncbi:unnamed protein product, partial [Amoebophrya sp. A120]|eukprot:GSA120T00005995001.1
MDDLAALEALLESNQALLAVRPIDVEESKLKQEWADVLETWQSIDRLWISQEWNRSDQDLVRILRRNKEDYEKEAEADVLLLRNHQTMVNAKKNLVDGARKKKQQADEALQKAIQQKEELLQKFGGKISVALAPVARNREQRVKKAMELQHKATLELSANLETLEKAELAARNFVEGTKSRIAEQQQREQQILDLCRQSFQKITVPPGATSASSSSTGGTATATAVPRTTESDELSSATGAAPPDQRHYDFGSASAGTPHESGTTGAPATGSGR